MKKRSAASTPRLLEGFTFLVEESLGKRLAQALVEQGLAAITHVDNQEGLPRGINDEEWTAKVGRENWVALTKAITYLTQ